MKYNVQIGEKSFEVLIEDINKRPVVAVINGHEFLVTPESFMSSEETPGKAFSTVQSTHPDMQDGVLVAPLPGTIIDIFVKPGDEIKAGQVILIIEAMKMKNSIRSTKDGVIAAVLVSSGQAVAHKQALVEFTE